MLAAESFEPAGVDGKVSLSVANELAVPAQLHYLWKGKLSPKPLATIKPGRTKTTSTKHGVQWQVSAEGGVLHSWTVDSGRGKAQTLRLDAGTPSRRRQPSPEAPPPVDLAAPPVALSRSAAEAWTRLTPAAQLPPPEPSTDGKVCLSVANELTVPLQLRYFWKGQLAPKPLATIKPGKTKSTSTKHGVQWQVSGEGIEGAVLHDFTVDDGLGNAQTQRVHAIGAPEPPQPAPQRPAELPAIAPPGPESANQWTNLVLAAESFEASTDGKVNLAVANGLTVSVQLHYFWKGQLSPTPLATIKPGKTKSTKTKHGVRWQVSGEGTEGAVLHSWTVDSLRGKAQTLRLYAKGMPVIREVAALARRDAAEPAVPAPEVLKHQAAAVHAPDLAAPKEQQQAPTVSELEGDQFASQLATALARAKHAEMKAQVERQRNAQMQAEWSAAVVIQGQYRRRELQQNAKQMRKLYSSQLTVLREQVVVAEMQLEQKQQLELASPGGSSATSKHSSPQGISPGAARLLAVEAVSASKRETQAAHAEAKAQAAHAEAEREARKAAENTAREAATALATVMQIEEAERTARDETVLELQAQLRAATGGRDLVDAAKVDAAVEAAVESAVEAAEGEFRRIQAEEQSGFRRMVEEQRSSAYRKIEAAAQETEDEAKRREDAESQLQEVMEALQNAEETMRRQMSSMVTEVLPGARDGTRRENARQKSREVALRSSQARAERQHQDPQEVLQHPSSSASRRRDSPSRSRRRSIDPVPRRNSPAKSAGFGSGAPTGRSSSPFEASAHRRISRGPSGVAPDALWTKVDAASGAGWLYSTDRATDRTSPDKYSRPASTSRSRSARGSTPNRQAAVLLNLGRGSGVLARSSVDGQWHSAVISDVIIEPSDGSDGGAVEQGRYTVRYTNNKLEARSSSQLMPVKGGSTPRRSVTESPAAAQNRTATSATSRPALSVLNSSMRNSSLGQQPPEPAPREKDALEESTSGGSPSVNVTDVVAELAEQMAEMRAAMWNGGILTPARSVVERSPRTSADAEQAARVLTSSLLGDMAVAATPEQHHPDPTEHVAAEEQLQQAEEKAAPDSTGRQKRSLFRGKGARSPARARPSASDASESINPTPGGHLLDLSSKRPPLGDKDIAAVATRISAFGSALELIDLSENQVSVEGGRELADAVIGCPSLCGLNLRSNRLGGGGMWVLANVLVQDSSFRITELDVSANKLGDVGARALGLALKDNKGLVKLAAESNQVYQVGCAALAGGLAHNTCLRELRLGDNAFGEAGVDALVQAVLQQGHGSELMLLDVGDVAGAHELQQLVLQQQRDGSKLDDAVGAEPTPAPAIYRN